MKLPMHPLPQISILNPHGGRICEPPAGEDVPETMLNYANAQELAGRIDLARRTFAIVNGSFHFGDLIEALCVEKNLHVAEMTISTLSVSQNNIDSLKNLLEGGYVDRIDLLVSDFFYAHERQGLVPYAYETLDSDSNRFQLAAARTHCKVTLIRTHCGKQIVMHGSANLRSSGNSEQVQIEDSPALYAFNYEFITGLMETHKTINHGIRKQRNREKDTAGRVQDTHNTGAVKNAPTY